MRRDNRLLRLVEPTKRRAEGKPHDPVTRGYNVTYHEGETNRCPGCGRSQFYVGRFSAQCAFCETAMPFARADR